MCSLCTVNVFIACEVMEDVIAVVLLLLVYDLQIHGRRGKSVSLLTRLVQIERILNAGVSTEVSAITFCEESAMTIRYVERCPVDLKSWERAAKDMDCESIDHNCSHNLSKGDHRFQYHCVINNWINATLEVCALNRTIFDYCTEYNVMGRVMQENYKADCTKHDPPCPAIYNSAEAYKYQTCYELVRKDRRKSENKDSHAQNPDLRSRSIRIWGNLAYTFLSMFQIMPARILR